jgi:hypothetical protein
MSDGGFDKAEIGMLSDTHSGFGFALIVPSEKGVIVWTVVGANSFYYKV